MSNWEVRIDYHLAEGSVSWRRYLGRTGNQVGPELKKRVNQTNFQVEPVIVVLPTHRRDLAKRLMRVEVSSDSCSIQAVLDSPGQKGLVTRLWVWVSR